MGSIFKHLETQLQFFSSCFESVSNQKSSNMPRFSICIKLNSMLYNLCSICIKSKSMLYNLFSIVLNRKHFIQHGFQSVLNQKASYTTQFFSPNFCIKSKSILYTSIFTIFTQYKMFFVPKSSIFKLQKIKVGHHWIKLHQMFGDFWLLEVWKSWMFDKCWGRPRGPSVRIQHSRPWAHEPDGWILYCFSLKLCIVRFCNRWVSSSDLVCFPIGLIPGSSFVRFLSQGLEFVHVGRIAVPLAFSSQG